MNELRFFLATMICLMFTRVTIENVLV